MKPFTVLGLALFQMSCWSQIPKRALQIADSLCAKQIPCEGATFSLKDSSYYDTSDKAKEEREEGTYYFTFHVQLKDDLKDDISISLFKDLSVRYISGIPDKSYQHSPCSTLPREELWKIAKKKGLRSRFKTGRYSLHYGEKALVIAFHQWPSRWDLNQFRINAITGEFIEHERMNVTF